MPRHSPIQYCKRRSCWRKFEISMRMPHHIGHSNATPPSSLATWSCQSPTVNFVKLGANEDESQNGHRRAFSWLSRCPALGYARCTCSKDHCRFKLEKVNTQESEACAARGVTSYSHIQSVPKHSFAVNALEHKDMWSGGIWSLTLFDDEAVGPFSDFRHLRFLSRPSSLRSWLLYYGGICIYTTGYSGCRTLCSISSEFLKQDLPQSCNCGLISHQAALYYTVRVGLSS